MRDQEIEVRYMKKILFSLLTIVFGTLSINGHTSSHCESTDTNHKRVTVDIVDLGFGTYRKEIKLMELDPFAPPEEAWKVLASEVIDPTAEPGVGIPGDSLDVEWVDHQWIAKSWEDEVLGTMDAKVWTMRIKAHSVENRELFSQFDGRIVSCYGVYVRDQSRI